MIEITVKIWFVFSVFFAVACSTITVRETIESLPRTGLDMTSVSILAPSMLTPTHAIFTP